MSDTKFIINGKEYSRLEDVPPEFRQLVKDAQAKGSFARAYDINGKTYDRLEDVPPEFRRLLADNDGDGVPDIVQGGTASARKDVSTGQPAPGFDAPATETGAKRWLNGLLVFALAASLAYILFWK